MCPNASMIPSLARMRLATASSWRSAASGSAIDVLSADVGMSRVIQGTLSRRSLRHRVCATADDECHPQCSRAFTRSRSDLLAFFGGFANPPPAIRNNLGAKLGFDALELGMP